MEITSLIQILQSEGFECESDADKSVFRANIDSIAKCNEFITTVGRITNTKWNIERTRTKEPQRMLLHKMWGCHHGDHNKGRSQSGVSKKSTHCQAKIDILVKLITTSTKKRDPYLKMNPPLCAVVRFIGNHNHNLAAVGSLRHLPLTDSSVKDAFLKLFADGLAPVEAIRAHENEVMISNNAVEQLANGSVNPLPRAVYSLWQVWKRSEFGSISTPPLTKLVEKVGFYKEKGIDIIIRAEAPWCVLVVSNIMKRAQALPTSAEIIYIDSTPNCDSKQRRKESLRSYVTEMFTVTKAGAVQLATLIHGDTTALSYLIAFRMIRENFPKCFGGKSAPAIFMTDDSASVKAALLNVFPEAKQFICHFHMVQSEWKWMLSSSSGVKDQDRQTLIRVFQKIMYAKSDEVLYEAISVADKLIGQESFLARLHSNLDRKEEWIALYRQNTMLTNHDMYNYAEATIRIMKNIILNRTKGFNAVALVEFCSVLREQYWVTRLLSFAHDRKSCPHFMYEGLCKKMDEVITTKVRMIDESTYEVPSATDKEPMYRVDVELGICNCPCGDRGAYCKHLAFLHKNFSTPFPNTPACTLEERYSLGQLALGELCPNIAFFQGMKNTLPKNAQLQTSIKMEISNEDSDEEDDVLRDPLHDCSIYQVDVEKELDRKRNISIYTIIKDQLHLEMRRIDNLLDDNHSEVHTKYLTKLVSELKNITSAEQATEVLIILTSMLSQKSRAGRKNKVQPTALNRKL